MDALVSTSWLADQLGQPDLRVLDCTVLLAPQPGGGFAVESGRAAWELEPHGALTAVRFAWYGVRPVSAASRFLVRLCEVRWHHLLMRSGLLGLKTRAECGAAPRPGE